MRTIGTTLRLLQTVHWLWVVGIGGMASTMVAAFLQASPTVIVLSGLLGAVSLCVLIAVIVAILQQRLEKSGIYSPIRLRWYWLPIRKISWSFDNYLGGSAQSGGPVKVSVLQAQLRVNWGKGIEPKNAVLRMVSTGAEIAVLIECGNPYVLASEIRYMPPKRWFHCGAIFDRDGLTKEEFFQKYDAFDFEFQHAGGTFTRRFSRHEIRDYFDRYWESVTPPKPLEPRRRASG